MGDNGSIDRNQAVIRVVQWLRDDRQPDQFVTLNRRILAYVRAFLESAVVVDTIEGGLRDALAECPLWTGIPLTELSRDQRETVAGRFLLQAGTVIQPEAAFEVRLH